MALGHRELGGGGGGRGSGYYFPRTRPARTAVAPVSVPSVLGDLCSGSRSGPPSTVTFGRTPTFPTMASP